MGNLLDALSTPIEFSKILELQQEFVPPKGSFGAWKTVTTYERDDGQFQVARAYQALTYELGQKIVAQLAHADTPIVHQMKSEIIRRPDLDSWGDVFKIGIVVQSEPAAVMKVQMAEFEVSPFALINRTEPDGTVYFCPNCQTPYFFGDRHCSGCSAPLDYVDWKRVYK